MPYIPKGERIELEDRARKTGNMALTPGQLNFAITTAIISYLGSDPHYKDYNEVIGVLECAKLELYRRMVAPYEDRARDRNGDVY